MSSKMLAQDVKLNDIVDFKSLEISGYTKALKIRGVVSSVFDSMIGNIKHKFIEVYTNEGRIGTYIKFTDEVIKLTVDESTKMELVTRPAIRNLRRSVDRQGSDPEIFIVDKDNNLIPAFKFLGSKEEPDRIPQNSEPLFWDGFQAEFNIPANSCLDSSVYHVWYGLNHLNRLAKEYNKDARLTVQTAFQIPPHILRNEKEEHVAFGCMPSENVYGIEGIKVDGRDVTLRSSGGHIHLQLNSSQKKNIKQYVKALDAILGVACVSLFGSIDNPQRREYYGLAGEYRTPSHGIEYRTLSNAWLCHPTIMYIVYELARKVITLVDDGYFELWKYNEEDVISCINECNIPLAYEILRNNEELFKDILHSFCYRKQDIVDVVYATIMLGVENLINEVDNIEKNWNLKDICITGRGRISELKNINDNFERLAMMKF